MTPLGHMDLRQRSGAIYLPAVLGGNAGGSPEGPSLICVVLYHEGAGEMGPKFEEGSRNILPEFAPYGSDLDEHRRHRDRLTPSFGSAASGAGGACGSIRILGGRFAPNSGRPLLPDFGARMSEAPLAGSQEGCTYPSHALAM